MSNPFEGQSDDYGPNPPPPNDVPPAARYRRYKRTQIAEMVDWYPGFDMTNVSISQVDRSAGCPKLGDKIARNPSNHDDRWLVSAVYFAQNFEELLDAER